MEFKRIIFGDFHGHFDTVNQIYQKEQPHEVIHLGDYFDNFSNNVEKIKGDFEKLLELREQHIKDPNKGDFILLIGNHDYHYWMMGLEKYSGYNKGYDVWAHQQLSNLVDNNQLKLLHYDYTSKTIYSHAGVTNTWLKENRMEFVPLENISNVKDINPYSLRFTYLGGGDWYGDTKFSSPIWIRPNSLLTDMYVDKDGNQWTQVVGHTNSQSPVCYYKRDDKLGVWPRVTDNVIVNNREEKPILYIMDCMPFYYMRETINEYGSVLKREIIFNH